jgi:hypothetical protein
VMVFHTINNANFAKRIEDYLFGHSGELDLSELNHHIVSLNQMMFSILGSISKLSSISILKISGNYGENGLDLEDSYSSRHGIDDVLTNESVNQLAIALQTNQTITEIDLSHNLIGNNGMNSIATMLLVNKTIRSLNLSNNLKISQDQTKRLARNVRKSGQITKLGMLQFEVDFEIISLLLSPGLNLEMLEIDLDPTCWQTCQLFAINTSITDLRINPIRTLNGNSFGFFNMCAFNQNIHKFRIISCSKLDFSQHGVSLMASAFKRQISINTLILQKNRIYIKEACAIANMLSENSSITVLDLFGNELQDVGAKEIAKSLTNNTTSVLQVLNLGENRIKHSATDIAMMLKSNSTLVQVGLAGNSIDDDGVASICEALQKNYRIEFIDLQQNDLTEASGVMKEDEERILLD